MLFYRAALPLSHQTLTFVSGLVRAHRRQSGSVWRKLDPGQQALLVLVYLRKGETFAEVGAGFGVSTTTCWRYVNETGRQVITPYKGRNKPESQKDANRAHARLRGPGERAHAQLKTWHILRKLRCCPRRAGRLAKAIHVLQNYEVTAG